MGGLVRTPVGTRTAVPDLSAFSVPVPSRLHQPRVAGSRCPRSRLRPKPAIAPCLMRSAIFSRTRKRKSGSVVICRNWSDTSVAITSSTGAPPRATTTPLLGVERGRTEQRTAAQKRDNAVLRQYERASWAGVCASRNNCLAQHGGERAEVAARLQLANGVGNRDSPARRLGTGACLVSRFESTARQQGLGMVVPSTATGGRGSGAQSPGVTLPPWISQIVGRAATPPGGIKAGAARWHRQSPEDHRVFETSETLAARRNNANTLANSGSAICALRTRTFTCSVASWIVSLSSMFSGVPAGIDFRYDFRPHEIRVGRQRPG